jgi:hypothetical protein
MGMTDVPKPKPRWYRFRLRTLPVLMLLASIGIYWVAVKIQRARQQRELDAVFESLKGVRNTVWNIQANPEVFAKQYAGGIVYTGWTAVAGLLALAVIAGIALNREFRKPPAGSGRQSPAPPDRPGG